jgi:tRNA threonylcarbamoyladenosine biosynthesis protein TsaB
LNLLLINSGDENAFAGLYDGSTLAVSHASEFSVPGSRKQPDNLILCLDKLVKQDREAFDNSKAIAVTIGPGSFTGIRVGLAIAKGAAEALGISLIPITNFELIYNRIGSRENEAEYCILLPAKLPEYYYALWRKAMQVDKGCVTFENLSSIIDEKTTIVGNFGNESLQKHSYFEYLTIKDLRPEEDSMLKLAVELYENGKISDPSNVEPLYMKDFVAKKAK